MLMRVNCLIDQEIILLNFFFFVVINVYCIRVLIVNQELVLIYEEVIMKIIRDLIQGYKVELINRENLKV